MIWGRNEVKKLTYNGRSPYEKYLITLCSAQMIDLKIVFTIDLCLFILLIQADIYVLRIEQVPDT